MKCCRLLLSQIVLSYGAIHPCCSYTINFTGSQLMLHYRGQLLDINKYIESRQKYIDDFNDGDVPPCYNNCSLYQESKNSSNKVCFEIINVSNRTNCSCNCIYCDLHEKGNEEKRKILNKRKPYDIKPVLLNLQNKNLISDKCVFQIGGGECSEYPKEELEWLLLFALQNNCKIELMSSGITFSPAIEKVLSIADINFKLSPDSGTKAVYEKIKRVKAFNLFWNNISRYIQAAKDNPKAKIQVKYVIIPGINDNIEEVKAFLNQCRKVNAQNIAVDIEHYFLYEKGREGVTRNLMQTVRFFEAIRKHGEFDLDYIQVGKPFLQEIMHDENF